MQIICKVFSVEEGKVSLPVKLASGEIVSANVNMYVAQLTSEEDGHGTFKVVSLSGFDFAKNDAVSVTISKI